MTTQEPSGGIGRELGRAVGRVGYQAALPALGVHREIARPVLDVAEARFVDRWAEWGESFRDAEYTDADVIARLTTAVRDLEEALKTARWIGWANGHPEIVKRAADVINQAFFAADATRLAMTASPDDLLRSAGAESDESPE